MSDIFDWSTTASSNTTVDGVGINTGMDPGNVDNAFRSLMSVVRSTFTSGLQNFLAGSAGLGVANGGTGVQTLTGIPKGNGTSAFTAVANASANGKQFLRDDYTFAAPLEAVVVYLTDEATAQTTGTAKRTVFWPYNFTITEVFTAVTTRSSSGVVTGDMNIAGSTVFSTNPSIDANEDTSLTGTAAVLSTTSIDKGAKVTFDCDAAGTGAKGFHFIVVGRQR